LRKLRHIGSISAVAALIISGIGAAQGTPDVGPKAKPAHTAPEGNHRADVVTPPTASATAEPPPYRGWSSWSMQSSNYPGLNPRGGASWLHEENVLAQARAMAKHLKKFGYEYINLDSGWSATWDWRGQFDQNGRAAADKERFPRGMKYVADEIHRLGLKAGIYLPVGLDKGAYEKGDLPIADAPECSLYDIVYDDKRSTNGWDSAYKIDFAKPCAQAYIDSQAKLIADWGYDFLKLDGVGPGSFKQGPNYDNRADVEAWHQAIAKTGRKMHFQVSWSLERSAIDTWQKYSDSWRLDTDVECYCDTLVTWHGSVSNRFYDVPAWVQHSGKGGWNNLDTINVAVGKMDGLTPDERRAYMTLWSISAAPLYAGDDLTQIDKLGWELLTNKEVLAINEAGRAASPVTPKIPQQVWRVQNADGSYTVALFNLAKNPAIVEATWSDLGFTGPAKVRDVWSGKSLGTHDDGWFARIPAHGTRLLNVTPTRPAQSVEAEAAGNTLTGSAKVSGCEGCADGLKVGDLSEGASVTLKGFQVAKAGTYDITVSYTDGSDGRQIGIAANGGNAQKVTLGGTGDDQWDRVQSTTYRLALKEGANTITFSNVGGYGPDIDRVTVQAR
jgi:hypothetical protein